MATIEINGQNHEVLTYTSQAYGVATAAANLAVQTSSHDKRCPGEVEKTLSYYY